MPFQTGKTKTGGRQKGQPNSVTGTLRQQVQHLLESQFNAVLNDLEALEPKDRVNAWIKLLDFALPKLQRTETTFDASKMSDADIERLFDVAVKQQEL